MSLSFDTSIALFLCSTWWHIGRWSYFLLQLKTLVGLVSVLRHTPVTVGVLSACLNQNDLCALENFDAFIASISFHSKIIGNTKLKLMKLFGGWVINKGSYNIRDNLYDIEEGSVDAVSTKFRHEKGYRYSYAMVTLDFYVIVIVKWKSCSRFCLVGSHL